MRAGVIAGRCLGAKVAAYDAAGHPVTGEVGELVLTEPMPSMPVGFWNDPGGERYAASYFAQYPGVWRHGDWIMILPDGGCVIYGRSDATLNRGGVRMGTSEFYRVVERLPEIADSLVIDTGGLGRDGRLILYVTLADGCALDDGLHRPDPVAAARRAVAAARPGRDPPGTGHPPDAVRQEAGGSGQEDPAGHPAGRGSRPGRAGESGSAAVLRAEGAAVTRPASPRRTAARGAGRAVPARRFGEEGGRLTYGSYLRLPELLAQQVPQADPPAHDELLFITVHQAYELWFQQLLHELGAARDAMAADETWRARQLLRRAHVIERLLVSQIDVLETMTPQDFLEFRAALAPASGFQSVQFRELEFLSGAKDERYIGQVPCADRPTSGSGWPGGWPSRRSGMPTWACSAPAGCRCAMPTQVLASLVSIARDRAGHDDLWQLAEDLLTHDELAGLWRARHVQMVERQIGTKSGTGGSTGAPYLHNRVPLRYYPLLWELRDWL